MILPTKTFETTTDADISSYYDFHHKSLETKGGKNAKGRGKKPSKGNSKNAKLGSQEKNIGLTSRIVLTTVEKAPELRVLENGVDLKTDLKPWCCYGKNSWNGRNFAHGFSSNFSSPGIATAADVAGEVGVDFISDWANIKALIKSNSSEAPLSYLIHRLGNTLTVDHLDLTGLGLFPDFAKLPAAFRKFIIDMIGEYKVDTKYDKTGKDQKHDKSVLSKEAYHQLLHQCMKTPMILDRTKMQSKSESNTSSPVQSEFLHCAKLSTGKFKLLVGSNIPTYSDGKENVTIHPSVNTETVDDALDLWLDNNLMQCRKTLTTRLKGTMVTKTDWIQTEDLPKLGKFDVAAYLEHTDRLLSFLQESVKTGSSYWLHRAPGSVEMKLYNLSNISYRNEDGSTFGIFENWEFLEPYVPYFNVASLTKYVEVISEVVPEKFKLDSLSLDFSGGSGGKSAKIGEARASKLNQKFDGCVTVMEKILKKRECSSAWLIRNINQIRICDFQLILECVKSIYKQAIFEVPALAKKMHIYPIERFLIMCLKLKKMATDKSEVLLGKNVWKESNFLKEWIESIFSGISETLICLRDWSNQLDLKELNPKEKTEWSYVGCRILILYSDSLTMINERKYDVANKSLARRLDQDPPPSRDLEFAAELLQLAFLLVPEADEFRVRHPLMLPSLPMMEKGETTPSQSQIVRKNALLEELHQKTSVSIFRLISHRLTFPPYLEHDFSISSETNGSENDTPISSENPGGACAMVGVSPTPLQVRTLIGKCYKEILDLLFKCISHAEQVKNPKGTEFEYIQPLEKAKNLCTGVKLTIAALNNSETLEKWSDALVGYNPIENSDKILLPQSDDIFRRRHRGYKAYHEMFRFQEEYNPNIEKPLPVEEQLLEDGEHPDPNEKKSEKDMEVRFFSWEKLDSENIDPQVYESRLASFEANQASINRRDKREFS